MINLKSFSINKQTNKEFNFGIVYLFSLLHSFTANYDDTTKYPSLKSIKYPKANTPNPIVTINVVDVSMDPIGYPKKLYIPFKYSVEFYVGAMTWVSAFELSVTLTDRNQTKAVTYLCKALTFECMEVGKKVYL